MDIRLFEASQTGDIQLLHQLLAENPLLLHSLALTSTENPLHVASIAGHLDFVKEIVKIKPAFVKELNPDGFTPMHIASANGYLEMVKELLKVDPRLCRLNGRDQWTPIHYAASRGRVHVMREIVFGCPESVEDVTIQGETVMHLAVTYSQFEAVKALVEMVREMNKVHILNMKDKHGNSVLHLAIWKRQQQVVEWLVGNGTSACTLQANNVNQSGLTALDLLSESGGCREIEEILSGAGASRTGNIDHTGSESDSHTTQNNSIPMASPETTTQNNSIPMASPETPTQNNSIPMASSETTNQNNSILTASSETHESQQPNNLMEFFEFKRGRDSPSDARTALLVVAVLVATATYQLAANPPGGVWEDTLLNENGTTSDTSNEYTHYAGTDIQGSYYPVFFILFAVFNSIGFSVSLYMIEILTTNFPLQLELHICILAMYFTYCNALIYVAPGAGLYFLFVLTPALPRMLKLVLKCGRPLINFIKAKSQPLLNQIQRFNDYVNN